MITGTVNADWEAILRLAILDVNGQEHQTDTLIDTGFNGSLSLQSSFISALGLPLQGSGRAILADGSDVLVNIYETDVMWDGHPRTIRIYEADREPLVGMSLMYGYELVLPVLDGATFTSLRIANP